MTDRADTKPTGAMTDHAAARSPGAMDDHAAARSPGAMDDHPVEAPPQATPGPPGRQEARSPLVALTRSEEDNAVLGALLEARGLRWCSVPCVAPVATRPGDTLLASLRAAGPFAAVAFPSRRAVEGLLDIPAVPAALGLPFEGLLVAAVGPATAEALRDRGWPVSLEPKDKTGAALAMALAGALPPGARVLLPGGDRARPELREGLATRGLVPVPLQVYAHAPELSCPPLPERPDAVVCASPSAAERFLAAHPGLGDLAFVAIGPTTEAALIGLGARRVMRAQGPTPEALADATVSALRHAPAHQDPAPSSQAQASTASAPSPARGPQGRDP